ncbi:MAG: pyrroline-5-carboxylate reductase [Saprospiraceae bacterium]|nr:pyrroline-5-carboxylate reductase [Saprospiraceae bacterium]
MNVLIIGGGNMGLTYAQAFIRSHVSTPEQMMILEHLPEKAGQLKALNLGTVYLDSKDCLHKADVIILAVKPQDSASLFAQIRPNTEGGQVFLSIMAGVRIAAIQEALGVKKVIRAMPNLPAQIGQGMTAFTSADEVTRLELVMVQNLLATTGKAVYVEKEEMIDAVTAISGSGPAYVYYFMDAMMQAATQMGFSQSESELLVVQTFTGAVDLYNKSDFSCAEWIQKVSSRGGTTEAALNSFKANTLHQDIIDGAKAALNRAVELGK